MFINTKFSIVKTTLPSTDREFHKTFGVYLIIIFNLLLIIVMQE